MSLVKWDDGWQIGIVKIDGQHRELVKRLNDFHTSLVQKKAQEDVLPLLHFLIDYTIEHFSAEELLMQEKSYPGFAAHKEMHKKFINEVNGMVGKIQDGKQVFGIELCVFIADWIREHIREHDQKIAMYLGY